MKTKSPKAKGENGEAHEQMILRKNTVIFYVLCNSMFLMNIESRSTSLTMEIHIEIAFPGGNGKMVQVLSSSKLLVFFLIP